MKRITLIPIAGLLLLSFIAGADTLKLKDGNVLTGSFQGGTETTVKFLAFGDVLSLATSDIVSLTFEAATSQTAAPVTAPPPAPVARPVTLPAGTILLVRMLDSVSSRDSAGANFTTKLEYDLIADGVIVAKAGTKIYGKVKSSSQARRARGRSTLDLRLVQMVPNGSPVPISTSSYVEAGENSIKKVAKAAAVGAVIGNNTGSGSSSDGAAIGAGVAMLKPGQTLTVSPGTVLEFSLTQPVTVNP